MNQMIIKWNYIEKADSFEEVSMNLYWSFKTTICNHNITMNAYNIMGEIIWEAFIESNRNRLWYSYLPSYAEIKGQTEMEKRIIGGLLMVIFSKLSQYKTDFGDGTGLL